MAVCPSCAFESPAGFKFCGSCGTPLAAAPATPTVKIRQPAEERRTVSILFADVAGFTAMSEKLDPEDVQEIMNGVFERVGAVIGGYGGTIDKYIGDAIMALFGAPVALGDDAERAVRAGMAILKTIAEYSGEIQRKRGFELKVRVGVNTGKVVWGRAAESQEFTVVGDAVNLASRLQSAAQIGTVLIGDSTQRHVRTRFSLEPLEPVMMKGKAEPQRTYRVLGELSHSIRTTLSGPKIPLVGRDEEMALLSAALDAVRAGRGDVITIEAPAGTGKSRLVKELRHDAEEETVTVLPARAPPFGHGAPFAPWTDLFQRVARLEGLPAAEARTKLSGWLAASLEKPPLAPPATGAAVGAIGPVAGPGPADDTLDVRAFHELANIADLDDPEVRRRREQPPRFRQILREALTSWLTRASTTRAATLLAEDLHWWPLPSLELLTTATGVARSSPLLVIGTKRPGTLSDPWPPKPDTDRTLELSPIDRAALLSLAHAVLGQNVPPSLVHKLESISLGNPLFAEEIIQIYIDRGALKAEGSHWIWDEALAEAAGIPTSVEGVTQARLDALPALEKRVLQSAAVAGRSFWQGQLAEAGASELPGILQRLTAREFILPRRSRIAGETEYEFKHAVMQQVAYENTLKKERVGDHRRIAAWLESKVGTRHEFAGEIAEHHRRAEEPALALKWILLAAEDAVRAFARLDEARVVEEAVTVARTVGDEAAIGKSLRMRGRLRRIAGHKEAESDLRRALEIALKRSDSVEQAEAGVDLAGVLHQRGALADAETVAKATLEAARASGNMRHETLALNMLGGVEQMRGRYEDAGRLYDEALACAKRKHDPALEGFMLNTIGNLYYATGKYAEAISSFQRALQMELSRENEAFLRSNLGAAFLGAGDAESAVRALDEALAVAEKIGSKFVIAEARIRRGAARAARGDTDAMAELDAGCGEARAINASEPLAEGLLRKGVLLLASDGAAARKALEEGGALAERDGNDDLKTKIKAALARL